MNTTRLRVLVADDEPAVRRATAEMLQADPLVQVAAVARDAEEAVRLALAHRPAVALIDARMPGGGGPRATEGIRACSPETRVVAFSAWGDRSLLLEMIRAGAVGYVLKEVGADELVRAVHQAAQGQAALSPQVAAHLVDELSARLQRDERDRTWRRQVTDRIWEILKDPTGALRMEYQPIVDLRTGATVGMEALARFTAPPQRSPALWFAEAWELGLGVELEVAAARMTLRDLARVPREAHLFVNLSPVTVASAALGEALAGVEANRLAVEVTETAPIEDVRGLDGALRELRARGARLAVDDAGAGYSGLRRILRLRPEFIKLDMVITRDIDTDPARRALARAMVSFAEEVGAMVVAEGIESADEARILQNIGVAFGQGYHLGRPGPLPGDSAHGWKVREASDERASTPF